MLLFLFLARHAALLLVALAAAAGAGTLVAGRREPLALRAALGLAVWSDVLFLLAALGWLRPAPMVLLLIVALAGGAMRSRLPEGIGSPWLIAFVAMGIPAFLLALQPPLAFDETLYHLPFVRALARSGELRFLGELRFPAFPWFHELLCVPIYLLAGDTATHLVSLIEMLIAAALAATWARRYAPRAAPLAAALFAGSPNVVHQATILYVESALTLFVLAGFYALDVAITESRRKPLLFAGLFFGAACSVKYLGGFFALSALIILLVVRRRDAPLFALTTAAAALPTTLWLTLTTGNPVFPFLTRLFGRSAWMPLPEQHNVRDIVRVLWDVTFARERVNQQPPVTPLLIGLVLLVVLAAYRNWRPRALLLFSAVYLGIFMFLPRDSRYLLPLLPLVCVCAAVFVALRFPRWTTIATLIAIAPGAAYLAWRLVRAGLPPAGAQARHAVLAKRIPGYEALTRAGRSNVYVCGAEQLQYYARGTLRGDFFGLHPYGEVLDGAGDSATLAARLRALDVDYFLADRQRCAPRRPTGGLQLVYEDAGAQLWRVLPRTGQAAP